MKPASKRVVISNAIRDTAAAWLARRDGGLSAAEEAEFAAWRNADERHAVAVARLQAGWSALDRPLETGVAANVLDVLRCHAVRRRRRRWNAMAATLTVLLASGILWTNGQRHDSEIAPATAVVRLPEKRVLPDGSLVEVGPNAVFSVEFDRGSSGPRRVVLTKGEAHFDVATDPARPFIVVAGGVEFRAVGTEFSIHLGSRDVELLVTEGRVAVEKPAPALAPASVESANIASTLAIVVAGNRVAVDLARTETTGPAVPVEAEEVAERLAWRAARLEFTGTPLSEAIALVNQHSRTRFVFEDATLGREQVSGVFRTDNTDGFIHLLQHGFGFDVERRSEQEVVLRRKP